MSGPGINDGPGLGRPAADEPPAVASPELSALEGMVAQADAQAGQTLGLTGEGSQGVPQVAPQGPDFAQEAGLMVDMFASLVGGFSDKAGQLWTDQKRALVASSLAPVLVKYNFSLGAMPVELGFLIAAGPVLWQTSRIIAAEMQAKEKAERAAKAARTVDAPRQPSQAGAQGPSPGAPVHPQMGLYQ
jgi:hypothetical protein